MKRRKTWLPVCLLALALAAVGITAAFMFREAAVKNRFQPAEVSCTVHEKLDGGEFTGGMHTGHQKHGIKIENTGNVDAYLRVRLVSYWVDADGNPVGLPSVAPALVLRDGWFLGSDGAYYFREAVAPGELTGILCAPIDLETSVDADGNTVYQALDVLGEAVQALPTTAVTTAWPVSVSADQTLTPA